MAFKVISTDDISKVTKQKDQFIIEDSGQTYFDKSTTIRLKLNDIPNILQDITYMELKDLKTQDNLIPGMLYKIIDYKTIYKQPVTNIIMGEYDSDCPSIIEPLILIATSTNTFDCKVFSFMHPKDEIWYDIENDTSKYDWAVANGYGVIYRRIDINNNDIPYDHKNIRFRRYQIDYNSVTQWNSANTYSKNAIVRNSGTSNYIIYMAHQSVPINENPTVSNSTYWQPIFTSCNTDFMVSNNLTIPISIPILDTNYNDFYTFDDHTGVDVSLYPNVNTNKIANNIQLSKKYLNDTVFLSNINPVVKNNSFDVGCTNNSFTGYVINNVIGSEFIDNICYSNFINNKIDNNYTNNIIGSTFDNNVIGNKFQNNIIGSEFTNNIIGSEFIYNIVNYSMRINKIGINVNYNSFNLYFINNTIGNTIYDNIINSFNSNNIIGNDVYGIITGSGFKNNQLGNSIYSINLANNFSNNVIQNDVHDIDMTGYTNLYTNSATITICKRTDHMVLSWWFNNLNQIEIEEIPEI